MKLSATTSREDGKTEIVAGNIHIVTGYKYKNWNLGDVILEIKGENVRLLFISPQARPVTLKQIKA